MSPGVLSGVTFSTLLLLTVYSVARSNLIFQSSFLQPFWVCTLKPHTCLRTILLQCSFSDILSVRSQKFSSKTKFSLSKFLSHESVFLEVKPVKSRCEPHVLSIIFCFTLFGSVVLFVTYAQNQYSAYAYNQYLRTTPVHFLYIRAGGRPDSVFFCQGSYPWILSLQKKSHGVIVN